MVSAQVQFDETKISSLTSRHLEGFWTFNNRTVCLFACGSLRLPSINYAEWKESEKTFLLFLDTSKKAKYYTQSGDGAKVNAFVSQDSNSFTFWEIHFTL